ncbi:MAG: FlgD immunoglobulin-like domain containing protein, partial [Calditrichota bacterium]
IRIQVFDMLGRIISEITDDTYPAGSHTFRWDGRNAEGRKAASGLYLLNIEAADYRSTIKMTMLK